MRKLPIEWDTHTHTRTSERPKIFIYAHAMRQKPDRRRDYYTHTQATHACKAGAGAVIEGPLPHPGDEHQGRRDESISPIRTQRTQRTPRALGNRISLRAPIRSVRDARRWRTHGLWVWMLTFAISLFRSLSIFLCLWSRWPGPKLHRRR